MEILLALNGLGEHVKDALWRGRMAGLVATGAKAGIICRNVDEIRLVLRQLLKLSTHRRRNDAAAARDLAHGGEERGERWRRIAEADNLAYPDAVLAALKVVEVLLRREASRVL